MKLSAALLVAALIGPAAIAGEVTAPTVGASEPSSSCVARRSSGRTPALLRAPKSPAQEARDLEAAIDALLECPLLDKKAQRDAPHRASIPARIAVLGNALAKSVVIGEAA